MNKMQSLNLHPKVKIFCWLLFRERLKTKYILCNRLLMTLLAASKVKIFELQIIYCAHTPLYVMSGDSPIFADILIRMKRLFFIKIIACVLAIVACKMSSLLGVSPLINKWLFMHILIYQHHNTDTNLLLSLRPPSTGIHL